MEFWEAIKERKQQAVEILIERQGDRCLYCTRPMDKVGRTIDHLMPKSRGGSYWEIDNLVLACPSCNRQKGDMTWEEYFSTPEYHMRRLELAREFTRPPRTVEVISTLKLF